MIQIRPFTDSDLNELRSIHARFYKDEFSLNEFQSRFLQLFTIFDSGDSDKVITIGGLRPLLELVAVTDKDSSARQRHGGLYKLLEVSEFMARRAGFDSFQAFIQDERWMKTMLNRGFKPTAGKSLFYKIQGV